MSESVFRIDHEPLQEVGGLPLDLVRKTLEKFVQTNIVKFGFSVDSKIKEANILAGSVEHVLKQLKRFEANIKQDQAPDFEAHASLDIVIGKEHRMLAGQVNSITNSLGLHSSINELIGNNKFIMMNEYSREINGYNQYRITPQIELFPGLSVSIRQENAGYRDNSGFSLNLHISHQALEKPEAQ